MPFGIHNEGGSGHVLDFAGRTAPAVSTSGKGRLYFDSTSNTFLLSANGSAYTSLAGGSVNVLAKTTTYSIIVPDDIGSFFTNEGAGAQVVFNLPPAAAGLRATFYVQNAFGLQVQADTGDTIRMFNQVSSAGGTATSIDVGSCSTLVAINSTEWISSPITGLWTLA